ncbi:MAG TPA: hypothetical protein GX506_02100, partial [Firmicutes bacterium]|nr:hypothetical protein [Bacillota bacterium]
ANDLGWGEIVIAASLASASGKTLDEVIALADSGLGWGEVAASLGVDTRGLGQSIRGVIGNSGKSKVDDDVLDDAAAEELLNNNFGLTQQELEQLAKSGVKKQDVLVAVSAAVAANDPATFENIIRLRQENRNWQQVFETMGIDPKGIRKVETAMIRSEVRTQLRERLKEFQSLRSGQRESAGLASGDGSEVADDHEQADDDDGAGSHGQQVDKDDQNAGDKDDQNVGDKDDKDDQDADDHDAGHGHGHAGRGSGGSSGGGGSKGKK